MNVSGYGDLIATWTAPVDWYLSYTLGMGGNFRLQNPATDPAVIDTTERIQSPVVGTNSVATFADTTD